ncbi:MAG: hypothetical protein JJU40_01980 [Rhodobacteraceae bacterium]|nr:hypothetical protein [Paracoccaceae bacterium]
MTQAGQAARGPEYCLYNLGTSRRPYRGPAPDLGGPYVACLGGSETFGRYVARPWPELLGRTAGVTCANFGAVNGGIDVILDDPALLVACHDAKMAILCVPGALNLSNRLFAVHPRRNDRLVRTTTGFRALFPAIDLTETHFTGHLLRQCANTGSAPFAALIEELQAAWCARMHRLIEALRCPVLLVWLAPAPPPERVEITLPDPGMPAFVDAAMLRHLRDATLGLVVHVCPPGEMGEGGGMAFPPPDPRAAVLVPGAAVHGALAARLAPALSQALEEAGTARPAQRPLRKATGQPRRAGRARGH